jgi:CheY-like chemotaxis protein
MKTPGSRSIDVLVIDDDDVATESVLRSLRHCQIMLNCVTAEDGMEGLEILRGEHPSKKVVNPMVVLLDLNMPRMDGLEFLTEIRADAILHSTVIFVLTTSSRDADRSQSYQSNIAGYMVKSEVGPQFAKLARLLAAYGDAVSLPGA